MALEHGLCVSVISECGDPRCRTTPPDGVCCAGLQYTMASSSAIWPDQIDLFLWLEGAACVLSRY